MPLVSEMGMHNPYLTLGFKARAAAGSPTHITELSPDPVIRQENNDKFGFLLLDSRIYTVKCLTYSAVNNMKDREDGAGLPSGQGVLLLGSQTGQRKPIQSSAESTEHLPLSNPQLSWCLGHF